MTYKWLIILLGILPVSNALEAAQTPAAPIPIAIVLRHRNPGNSSVHFGYLLAGAYKPNDRLESLSPIVRVKTLIFSSYSLPLVQLWGGRLELDTFQTTLRIPYAQLGPSGYGGMLDFRLPQQSFPGGPGSVRLSGLSVNFHCGRDWGTRRRLPGWRRLPRIVAAVIN